MPAAVPSTSDWAGRPTAIPTSDFMLSAESLWTPVTQRHFVRSPNGAMYGIEMNAQRITACALEVRTPVSGLLLSGQDVSGAGIPAACTSGLSAAAVIQPSLLPRFSA
jgi:phytoene dehydrogenase-like protein